MFPDTWLNEGYKLVHLNIPNQTAIFSKVNQVIRREMLQVISEAVQTDEPTMIDLDYAVGRIKEYYSESQKSGNGRYLSWEHCYSNFGKYRGIGVEEETIDFLCLHLAFYLASWGMYRGSSFLLKRDYRIHREVVIEILKQEYLPLWGISVLLATAK